MIFFSGSRIHCIPIIYCIIICHMKVIEAISIKNNVYDEEKHTDNYYEKSLDGNKKFKPTETRPKMENINDNVKEPLNLISVNEVKKLKKNPSGFNKLGLSESLRQLQAGVQLPKVQVLGQDEDKPIKSNGPTQRKGRYYQVQIGPYPLDSDLFPSTTKNSQNSNDRPKSIDGNSIRSDSINKMEENGVHNTKGIEKNILFSSQEQNDQSIISNYDTLSNNNLEDQMTENENISPPQEGQGNEFDSNNNLEYEFDAGLELEDFDTEYNYDKKSGTSFSHGLPDCSQRSNERDPVLIISTLDGQISGLNYLTGQVLWSHKTGAQHTQPMLSSTMSKLEVTSRGEWVRLIPSLDGGIYRFDGKNVEALPLTADTLLHSSFKFNEDTIFSGGKFSEILGIHPHTGEMIYSCNNKGCPFKQHSAANANQILVVKRVSQTVRAIDPKNGNERWNFSVGQHEVNIANTGCESVLEDFEVVSSLPSLHFVLPEGLIVAMDKNLRVSWKQKLPSPVVSAWSLQHDELNPINLFSSTSIPALLPEDRSEEGDSSMEGLGHRQPALYVGIHKQQLYIQQNGGFQKKVNSVLQRYISSSGNAPEIFPRVQWQPYLATAVSRTPVVHHGINKHPLLLDYEKKQHTSDLIVGHNLDYPYDNGYYLFGDDENSIFNESDHWSSLSEDEEPMYEEDDYIANHIYYMCFEWGPTIWWKVATVILIYAALHTLFVKFLMRRMAVDFQRATDRRAWSIINLIMHNILREHPQILTIIQRIGINVPAVQPPNPPATPPLQEEEIPPCPEATQRQDSNFSSRYTSDFEPVRCLGKGGFGVVFQVLNKLDQNEYAVKRIILPSKESSAERVKREVRALAKLNHSNIVRYYNSWLETPPLGWELEADSWWKKSDALSISLLSQEADFSEPPPVPITVDSNGDDSIFEVVSKLKPGVELEASMSHDSKAGDSSSQCDSSDNDSVTGYESDDEDVIGKGNLEGTNDNDSFIVCFENSASNLDQEAASKHCSEEDSVLLECSSIEKPCHLIDSMMITGNDYSKFTCKTLDSSKSDSIVFMDSSGKGGRSTTPLKRGKSSSFSISSTQVKHRRRRRVKSQGLSKDHVERPLFLNLPSTTSRHFDKKDLLLNPEAVQRGIINLQSSPNPRTYLYIQMELCQKESLKDWLFAHPMREKLELYAMFNDIVHAVEYVHDRSLMHRDLKPSNIFFSLDGEIKIGDFGLVTSIEDENNDLTPVVDMSSSSRDFSSVLHKQRTLNAGTHLYMSPEQMSGQSYTYKVDIYSLGLIFFEMLEPFSTEMERMHVMLQAREMTFPPGFSMAYPDVTKLLHLTLHRDPLMRPTTRGIRAREPLQPFQKGLENVSLEEHFHLTRFKGHARSHSGSYSGLQSSTS